MLQKANEPSEEFKEYQKERQNLLSANSEKDEKGNPITEQVRGSNGEQLISFKIEDEKREQHEKEIKKLEKKYKEAVDLTTEKNKEFEKFLQEEREIEIHKIKLEYIPSDITAKQMNKILILIDD